MNSPSPELHSHIDKPRLVFFDLNMHIAGRHELTHNLSPRTLTRQDCGSQPPPFHLPSSLPSSTAVCRRWESPTNLPGLEGEERQGLQASRSSRGSGARRVRSPFPEAWRERRSQIRPDRNESIACLEAPAGGAGAAHACSELSVCLGRRR